jgi:hypothetical protein
VISPEIEDVDGDTDLTFRFRWSDAVISCETVEAELRITTLVGEPVRGLCLIPSELCPR